VKNKLRNLKRKGLKRNFNANTQVLSRFEFQNFDATGSASFTCVKRKIWHCENCGDQTDHSTRFCLKVPAERSHPDPKKRTGCILNQFSDKKENMVDEEVNLIQAQTRRKFDFGTY